ncbi:hypothetical protein L1887_01606 [Cichorium endivia]|nr:hypothetical protein L1887_01606 [Cichorium endivia]
MFLEGLNEEIVNMVFVCMKLLILSCLQAQVHHRLQGYSWKLFINRKLTASHIHVFVLPLFLHISYGSSQSATPQIPSPIAASRLHSSLLGSIGYWVNSVLGVFVGLCTTNTSIPQYVKLKR